MPRNNKKSFSLESVILRSVLISAGLLLVIVAFFSNALRSADFDPQQMRVYVERTIRFGGTFYENGLHNKGPLDPIIYRFAFTLGGYDAFWYAISGFIVLGTILIAYAAFRTSLEHTTSRSFGLAMALIAFFHFALAKTDYSGVLYSRNEVSYLLAAAWIFVLANRFWHNDKDCFRSTVVLGIIIGITVQTVLTTLFAAAAITFVWLSFMSARFTFLQIRKLLILLALSSFATFVSAPLWYLARGKFDEFWGGWWIYARFQSDASGRSLGNQFGWGWDNITQYYGDWPLSFAIVLASLTMLWLFWDKISPRLRTLHLGAILWLAGGWIELILSQRYSTHYFVVVALPTMILASLVVAHLYQLAWQIRALSFNRFIPLLALVASFVYFPNNSVKGGLEQFSDFKGIAHVVEQAEMAQPGDTRTVRAILDITSADHDALLSWTGWPWTYLNVERVSASRMIWSSMFLGEIYLAGSGPQWVVPNTWEWFAKDMNQSNPTAHTERNDFPRRPGNPFDDYVNQKMTLKYSGTQSKVWLRNDLAAILSQSEIETAATSLRPGPETIGNEWCSRYSFTANSLSTVLKLSIAVVDDAEKPRSHVFEIADGQVMSKDNDLIFDQSVISRTSQLHAVEIIVGNRSSILTVDGVIVGAHRLDASSSPEVRIETTDSSLKTSRIRTEKITWPSGCSNS